MREDILANLIDSFGSAALPYGRASDAIAAATVGWSDWAAFRAFAAVR